MDFYPSRKMKNRKILKRNRKRIWLISNLWMLYLILISLLFIPNSSTYSDFNDTEQIANTLATLPDFCSDEEYRKNHQNECKKKDNSGIGNGPEEGDDGEYGDPDNPGKGNDDKKDCLPEECVDDHPNDKDQKDPTKDNKEKGMNDIKDNSEGDNTSETESGDLNNSADNSQTQEADSQNNEELNETETPVESEATTSE